VSDDPKFEPRSRSKDPLVISTSSIVSHRTGRGVVVIGWGQMVGQFDPEDARRFAHTLLREADNAETDAFLYSHFKCGLGLTNKQLAVLLTEFRVQRAKLEQLAGLRSKERGDEIPEDDRR
jgi:hypothetical protein